MSDSYQFNVRSSILAQISKTQDENFRIVLLLMLGVLDEIGSKVDAVLRDEEKLRTLVLNGHSRQHSEHHDWVERRLKADAETQELIARGRPVLEWCEQKIIEETQFKKENRSTLRKLLDTALTQVVTIAVTALATAIVLTK